MADKTAMEIDKDFDINLPPSVAYRLRKIAPALSTLAPYTQGFRGSRHRCTNEEGTGVSFKYFYNKEAGRDAPCIFYCHGGGFFIGEVRSNTNLALEMAKSLSAHLILPDYRLADRFPFPAAHNDCYAVYRWLIKKAGWFEIDPNKLVFYGESAGGNLAAGMALRLRDEGKTLPRLVMMIYPVLDDKMESWSAREYVDTPVWNSEANTAMWRMYLKGWQGAVSPYASPLHAEGLEGFPPAYIETAQYDPLRDEGIAFYERLVAAGVKASLYNTRRTVHGFDVVNRNSAITQEAVENRMAQLRQLGLR